MRRVGPDSAARASCAVGERRLQQGTSRPAHEFPCVVARQPGHIGQPRERFDSCGASYRESEPMSLGLGDLGVERRERFFDLLDRPSLPQRQLRALSGAAVGIDDDGWVFAARGL